MKLIKTSDKLPPFGHWVLVRIYRDSWPGGVMWTSAARIDFNPDDDSDYDWQWEEFGPDEYDPSEVDYWFEIPLVGDEDNYVSSN